MGMYLLHEKGQSERKRSVARIWVLSFKAAHKHIIYNRINIAINWEHHTIDEAVNLNIMNRRLASTLYVIRILFIFVRFFIGVDLS